MNKDEGTGEYAKLNALCKETNGKVIRWKLPSTEPEQIVDAILLVDIQKNKVSVKPYGYTPQELYDVFIAGGWIDDILLERINDPIFCLATFPINAAAIAVTALTKLASLRPGTTTSFTEIAEYYIMVAVTDPVCPYSP